jgi:cytochrome c-type biogenesis protein CcsB
MMKHLFSTKVSFVLMIVFSVAMAVATFIENDHGTAVARAAVYESWWFEVILIWLAINFIAHIDKYKLIARKRWPVGLFHIAFVIIVLGAGITRYFGSEGTIHIREGEMGHTFQSSTNYLQLEAQKEEEPAGKRFEKPVTLSAYKFESKAVAASIDEQEFSVHFDEFIPGAHESFVSGPDTLVDIAIAAGTGREDYLLKKGESLQIGELGLTVSKTGHSGIQLFRGDSSWMISSTRSLHLVEMTSQKMGVLKAGEVAPLQLRTLYQTDSAAFMVKSVYEGKQLVYTAETDEKMAKNLPAMVKLRVENKAGKELLNTYTAVVSQNPKRHVFFADGKKYTIAYGPREEMLPFALKLRAFELERYPGSQSPSSYASEVSVVDHDNSFPYRVFMNNVLDYKGYRFYQASYDTDEKGTVLSVSQDRPGTYLTYLGYALLTLGMFFTLFAKGSRFSILNNRLKSLNKAKGLTVAALLISLQLSAHDTTLPDVSKSVIPAEHAVAYGRLVVQDLDGRMKPLNTLANEIARKLSGTSTITIKQEGGDLKLNAEQFLLSVQLNPVDFSSLPLIKIDIKKSAEIFKALGHQPVSSLSFKEFLDDEGRYLLQELVEEANRLKPGERNEGHKELLKVDERFNILYAVFSGDFLRLFPNRLDKNNTWYTAHQFDKGFDPEDGMFVKNITPLYMSALLKGTNTGDWQEADEILNYMNLYQQKAGMHVYPSQNQLKAELFYNNLNLGNRLFGLFWLLGIGMLGLAIVKLFSLPKWLSYSWNTGLVVAWAGFLAFTFHLALRWYIAGHAPWSDGFEMLIFVAWGVLLFGLLFGNRSHFTVPLGVLFSGTLLFVAFLDWLNPEITNLMPVLNSYWLKIHVAVIVSGYAPLALAAVMALLTLLLLLFKPKVPTSRWWRSMQELSIVNEMAITIGLFLLTVGTFLGGVWANESWGRYWAWDPKETWALISVMIYGFILHLRLIPKLKNAIIFNVASLWAFSSVIMTSFGVNYYLSGLHSYAQGDPVPVPVWIYWLVAVLAVITILAIVKYRSLTEKEKKDLLAV